MSSLEQQLTVLSARYGRYPQEIDGQHGFASRDTTPDELYPTIEEAVAAEAAMIRALVVMDQKEIVDLERQINSRLTHLGILEQ